MNASNRLRISAASNLVAVLALVACAQAKPVQTTFSPAYPERNSAGDPVVAVFAGIVPCRLQGCGRRKVEMVLYGREGGAAPTTYWLGSVSVGLGNERTVRQGQWRFVHGGPGNAVTIKLDANADPDFRNLWQAGNAVALLLDEKMEPLPGDGVYFFALNRDCRPYGPTTFAIDPRTGKFTDAWTDYGTCPKLAVQAG